MTLFYRRIVSNITIYYHEIKYSTVSDTLKWNNYIYLMSNITTVYEEITTYCKNLNSTLHKLSWGWHKNSFAYTSHYHHRLNVSNVSSMEIIWKLPRKHLSVQHVSMQHLSMQQLSWQHISIWYWQWINHEIWPKFQIWYVLYSFHSDICPGIICPFGNCPYQQFVKHKYKECV